MTSVILAMQVMVGVWIFLMLATAIFAMIMMVAEAIDEKGNEDRKGDARIQEPQTEKQ